MRRRRPRKRHDRGFTLLEVMIVLALIGLIAGTIGTQVYKRYLDGQIKTTRLQVRQLVGSAQVAMLDDPDCPTVEQMLARGQLDKPPRDPWGTPLTLECPAKNGKDPVDVSSAGPDKKAGTADDINSWAL